jgi:menaquinone-dependent protoporphyrinogen oxidase
MSKIIIIYSTTDGHTRKICQQLQKVIEQQAHQVELVSIDDVQQVDLQPFDKIVIGASIRYGKHSPQVYEFIKTNQQLLESKPNAFFSVNLVARKPEKNQPETNPYVRKFLQQISWQPREVTIFAGELDYQKYNFWDRLIIRFIMWMTKGPTDPNTLKDYTDWKQVDAFGQVICEM